MNYKQYLGKEYPSFTVEVEKGRLRFFADAVGEEDALYREESAAQDSGYKSLPVSLTFPFTITMDAGQSFNVLEDMSIPTEKAIHGEQGFVYHKPICAGDVISGTQKVLDIYEKKGGALLFIVTETSLTNQRKESVCDLQSTIVIRNG
ncbi:MAG: MaoC family dehydratase N-terminal domain-containing protein [Nitrospinaceae bacterium]|jgi:hypothetical protein|nr:MaoC family dehydratase N-terminal domain-containing protein [Nitrospinaceae bacterium]MDP6734879.1 MaoC family dehydratase N-terminal domain-containing protein [Nitrospinaceae bacterium]|tara:strand:+ start:168 stop:611 length:444 start_codon:yes stop_codon:yes gene_type:complete